MLRRLRRTVLCILWVESLLRATAPALGLLLAYVVLALFGLGNAWLFLGLLLAMLASLGWEGSRIRPPTADSVDRRIEAASGLRHRPLAALADVPATGGVLGAQIWQAHQARIAQSLSHARTGWPAPFAALRDPYSLRSLLLLLLASGAIIAGSDGLNRLGAAFVLPPWPFPAPSVNAWVTPPAYTGQAPLLLAPNQPVTVLTGSRITVLLEGSTDAIRFGEAELTGSRLGPESRRADGVITASGMLSIGPWWHRLARWHITAIPPSAPTVALAPPGLENGQLKLHWTTSDAYGLAALSAAIHPLGYDHALTQTAALPALTGKGSAELDTAASPYGGLPVAVTLTAVNLAGVHAATPPQTILLPAPSIEDPTARALARIRQQLALAPEQAPAFAQRMMRLAQSPPSAISFSADAQLAMLATALRARETGPEAAVQRLLVLIRQIEAGQDYEPSQELAQATSQLLEALRHGPPDADTLNRLLAALQQALARHIAAIRAAPAGQASKSFDASALNRLAAQIAADERAGRMQQAQAELQQLAATLQALQNARPMTAAQAAQAQAAAQAAQGLSQLIQGQANLLDQTARGTATPKAESQLQSGLKNLGDALAKAGIPNLPGLGAAGQDMGNAKSALTQQNPSGAQSAETSAIQNLQKAATALQNAIQQSLSIGMSGPTQGQSPNGENEDFSLPNLTLPGNNPADAIEQEIIHLDATPNLPPATHDYLHRLLRPDQ
jgi:Domain of unknown function (DUF4175)